MLTTPTRTVALLGATAATALAVAGCGSDHSHGTIASTTAAISSRSADAVDRAFVQQMVPHHRMALQMAGDATAGARRAEIKALARRIVAGQTPEIAQMQAAAKRLGVTVASMPSGHSGSMGHGTNGGSMSHGDATEPAAARTLGIAPGQMGMSMDMDALRTARPFDRAFIDEMIPHHQGAIRMARAELAKGRDADLKRLAARIVTAQSAEIRQMNAWRERWYGAASPAGGVPAA